MKHPNPYRGHKDKSRKWMGKYECPTCHGACTYANLGMQDCCYCVNRKGFNYTLCGYCERRQDYDKYET